MVAVQALRHNMSRLRRQRFRQAVVEAGFTGVLAGLTVACVAVPVSRLARPEWPLAITILGTIAACLAAATLWAWVCRESPLQVAIRVDRELRLNEQLSSAWQIFEDAPGSGRAEVLARQVQRARIPARLARVFPLRFGVYARFIPVVAALLVVILLTDSSSLLTDSRPVEVDDELALEGRYLQRYATAMASRAEIRLPRSAQAAVQMQRVASDMRSGRVDKAEALERLRGLRGLIDEQRLAALAAAPQTNVGAIPVEALSAVRGDQSAGELRYVVEQVLRGVLSADDADDLGTATNMLENAGVEQALFRAALQAFSAGERQRLEQLLDDLKPRGSPLRDAAELARAGDEVDRSRQRLGDDSIQSGPGPGTLQGQRRMERPGQGFASESGLDLLDEGGQGGTVSFVTASKPGLGGQTTGGAAGHTGFADPVITLKADLPIGEGEIFKGQVRALPHGNATVTESQSLSVRYQAQLEAVLAKESIPPRHKALVREYFLRLNTGIPETERTLRATP